MQGQPAVDPGQFPEPHLGGAAPRPQQLEQSGQQGDAGEEGDQHATASDDAELGNAAVLGGCEGVEAGGDGQRGQCQRGADLGRSRPGLGPSCIACIATAGPLRRRPIGHRVLDPEIDAEAHEEDGEGDRDQVEGAEDEQAKRRARGEADDEAGDDGQDDAQRAHRQPQHAEQRRQHDRGVAPGVLAEGGELLVGHRHLAGQAHAHAVGRVEAGALRRLADERGGRLAGLDGGEIELRLGQHEAAQRARVGRAATEQLLPGERHRAAGERAFGRARQGREGGLQGGQRRLATAHALQGELQAAHDAAQAGVGRQRAQQWLCCDQLLGSTRHFLGAQEEQAVAGEEGSAVGAAGAPEEVGSDRQPLVDGRGCLLGQLRRGAVDDDGDEVGTLRERGVEGRFALAPGQLGRDQLGAVGVDGEAAHIVDRGSHQERQSEQYDAPGSAHTRCRERDDPPLHEMISREP